MRNKRKLYANNIKQELAIDVDFLVNKKIFTGLHLNNMTYTILKNLINKGYPVHIISFKHTFKQLEDLFKNCYYTSILYFKSMESFLVWVNTNTDIMFITNKKLGYRYRAYTTDNLNKILTFLK